MWLLFLIVNIQCISLVVIFICVNGRFIQIEASFPIFQLRLVAILFSVYFRSASATLSSFRTKTGVRYFVLAICKGCSPISDSFPSEGSYDFLIIGSVRG